MRKNNLSSNEIIVNYQFGMQLNFNSYFGSPIRTVLTYSDELLQLSTKPEYAFLKKKLRIRSDLGYLDD
jgi:hypothetical protein